MNYLFRNISLAGLAIVMLLLTACDDDGNPLFSSGIDYQDGQIYDKTDSDNDGSKGKMNYNGYTYEVVRIGVQWWMAENLRTTRYSAGTQIPEVVDEDAWSGLTEGGWCNYNNEPATGATYGKLYNWFAVNTGKLAPPGWLVPSNAQWGTLRDYLGGGLAAGKPLKERGTEHWKSPNSGDNLSGFTALGSGGRFDFGPFYGLREYAFFWTSSASGSGNAGYYSLSYDGNRFVGDVDDKSSGYSVRCVKE